MGLAEAVAGMILSGQSPRPLREMYDDVQRVAYSPSSETTKPATTTSEVEGRARMPKGLTAKQKEIYRQAYRNGWMQGWRSAQRSRER